MSVSFMKTNYEQRSMSVGAYSFIGILDREIKGIKVDNQDIPFVINTTPFYGKGVKSRIANKLFGIWLRPTRRASRDFWYAQRDINFKLLQKNSILEDRLKQLEAMINESKVN